MAELQKPPVSKERTGWRDDLRLNNRHREWGWDCPAQDIDKLFIEYDTAEPVALIEYKHENAKPCNPKSAGMQALKKLGDAAQLPVYGVRYADNFSWWLVVPLNDVARNFLSEREKMTELQFVSLLYRIRGRKVPANLFEV